MTLNLWPFRGPVKLIGADPALKRRGPPTGSASQALGTENGYDYGFVPGTSPKPAYAWRWRFSRIAGWGIVMARAFSFLTADSAKRCTIAVIHHRLGWRGQAANSSMLEQLN
jgi:hypothetical protein